MPDFDSLGHGLGSSSPDPVPAEVQMLEGTIFWDGGTQHDSSLLSKQIPTQVQMC